MGRMQVLLETERIVLRRFTEEDANNLYHLDSDPDVMRFLSGGTPTPLDVIETDIKIGAQTHRVEFTLTNRDSMGFRMLIGRTAMKDRYLVDPGKSFLVRKREKGSV